MNKDDLEHKLLSGSPIYLCDIPTYKVTLGEMADNGFMNIRKAISYLCMDDDKAQELLKNDSSTFIFIVVTILREYEALENNDVEPCDVNDLLCITIPIFLKLFFRKDVIFNKNYGFIIGNENDENKFILNTTNYEEFRSIVKERNCLIDLEDIDEFDNPSSEMARKLLEKRKKLREKLNKAKQGNDDGLTMADLISIFAEAEHMPLQDVYNNYDIYQFNNQFNRLKIMDDFHVNIQALLAGAKNDDVKLRHWLSKINKQQD